MLEQFLMYVSLALVLTWTIQLARAKSRNPWAWGGAAVLIMAGLVWREEVGPRLLLSMLPMVVLLFLKAPQANTSPSAQGVTCARCQSNQPHGRYYCTSCGWELRRTYPDGQIIEEPANPPVAEPSEPAASTPPVPEPPVAAQPEAQADQTAVAQPAAVPEQDAPVAEEEAAAPAEPPPAPATPMYSPPPVPRSVLKPMSRGAPTAVAMTQRGQGLLDEGRVQEAIDQFTKALALDGSHRPALEARAVAYERLGRSAEAEQDRAQLSAR